MVPVVLSWHLHKREIKCFLYETPGIVWVLARILEFLRSVFWFFFFLFSVCSHLLTFRVQEFLVIRQLLSLVH